TVSVRLEVLVGPALGVVTPAGSVSLNPTPVNAAVVLLFVIVKVSVEVPFSGMFVGLNALAIEGALSTVMVADAVFPCAVSFEVTLPLVLFFTPVVAPVTVTLIWQLSLHVNAALVQDVCVRDV